MRSIFHTPLWQLAGVTALGTLLFAIFEPEEFKKVFNKPEPKVTKPVIEQVVEQQIKPETQPAR